MSSVIEVKASNTVADFETRLEEIAAADEDADLLLPNQLRGRYFAGTAAQMQLIASWRRQCPGGRLRIHAPESADDAQVDSVLEKFVKTDHGLVGAALSSVATRMGERDLSARAHELVEGQLSGMQRKGDLPMRGPHALLLCLDDSRFKAPPQLYHRATRAGDDPDPLALEDFRGFAVKVLERLWTGTGVSDVREPAGHSLGRLLYELFRNTHQWARENADGNKYLGWSSVRGIRFDRLKLGTAKESKQVQGQPALREFIERPPVRPRAGHRLMVELTVFDCGPGIAARELRRVEEEKGQTDIADESEAFHKCLRKHFTDDRAGPSRGGGLDAALKALSDLQSFLWIRSGRLSLYRDFIAEPYEPKHRAGEPFLLDWQARIGTTEVAQADGAFITALIPITNVTE